MLSRLTFKPVARRAASCHFALSATPRWFAAETGNWTYQPANGLFANPRTEPDFAAPKQQVIIQPGTKLKIRTVKEGADGVLFLQLQDCGGWLFDRRPGVGTMCVREDVKRSVVEDARESVVLTIKPNKLPAAPVKLTKLDESMMHFPGVTTHNFYKGKLDVIRLKEALGRVVEKNPGLAGRIRSTDTGLEVAFTGDIGASFIVRPLQADMEAALEKFDSEYIAKNPLEWEQTIDKLGITNTGPGPDQVDKDAPLLAATYLQGAQMSTVSLSVSHLFGDGATKMMVLKAWDEEFKNEGSSTPMQPRDKVMETDALVKNSYTDWEQAAMKAFYPATYERHVLSRKVEDYNMVVVRIQESTMRDIKSAEAKNVKKGTIFSAQDALVAMIGNTLGAKWFSFTADLRGRSKSLAANASGNAFMTWYGTPSKPGQFTAMDIRNTINLKGLNCAKALEEAIFAGLEDSIDVNSWVKLQYPPTFGAYFEKQCRAMGFGSLPFLIRLNYHVVYQVHKGEYIMFHFGMKDDEALKMELAWRKLGETAVSRVSGKELLEFMDP